MTTQGVECRVEIPADCPFFSGHFPDNPVLPGIAQLCLVTQAWRSGAAHEAFITRIDQLRLLAPIRSDEMVSVRVSNPGSDARSHFTIERGGKLVSQGVVTWGGA